MPFNGMDACLADLFKYDNYTLTPAVSGFEKAKKHRTITEKSR